MVNSYCIYSLWASYLEPRVWDWEIWIWVECIWNLRFERYVIYLFIVHVFCHLYMSDLNHKILNESHIKPPDFIEWFKSENNININIICYILNK